MDSKTIFEQHMALSSVDRVHQLVAYVLQLLPLRGEAAAHLDIYLLYYAEAMRTFAGESGLEKTRGIDRADVLTLSKELSSHSLGMLVVAIISIATYVQRCVDGVAEKDRAQVIAVKDRVTADAEELSTMLIARPEARKDLSVMLAKLKQQPSPGSAKYYSALDLAPATRSAQLQQMRDLRTHLQAAMQYNDQTTFQIVKFEMHKDTHLFTVEAYNRLRGLTDEFIMSDSAQREIRTPLMHRNFELVALQELEKGMKQALKLHADIIRILRDTPRRMTRGNVKAQYKAFTPSMTLPVLQAHDAPAAVGDTTYDVVKEDEAEKDDYLPAAEYANLMADVRGLRWIQRRCWDQKFVARAPIFMDTTAESVMLGDVLQGSNEDVQHGGGYAQHGGGGDGDEIALDTQFDNADVQARIIHTRDKVRVMMRAVMRSGREVEAIAFAGRHWLYYFMTDVLIPQMRELARAWEDHVAIYVSDNASDDDGISATGVTALMRFDGVGQSIAYMLDDALVLYMFKALRLLVQAVSLSVAQSVFDETYVRTVYSEGRDPPLLRNMLMVALSIDATVQLLVMLVVMLLRYLFKTSQSSFIMDDALIVTIMGEYFISTVVLVVMGLVIARIMRRKRYFDMRNQGLRVAAGYRDAMMGVCAVNFVIPYIAIFT